MRLREVVPAVFFFFFFLLLSAWLVRDQDLKELLSAGKCQNYHPVGWWEDGMRARWGVGRERKQRWRAVQGGPMHGAAGS